MQYVGGYADLVALRGNAQDYDDVLIAISGDSDARRIQRSQAGASRKNGADSGESGTPILSWPVGEEPPVAKPEAN